MNTFTKILLSIATIVPLSSVCTAQQTGDFASNPIVTTMIDPGPAFSFEYVFADVNLVNLQPGLQRLQWSNPFGINQDVFVVPSLGPYFDLSFSWPFNPAQNTTKTIQILVMNYAKTDSIFNLTLEDAAGTTLDSALFIGISP